MSTSPHDRLLFVWSSYYRVPYHLIKNALIVFGSKIFWCLHWNIYSCGEETREFGTRGVIALYIKSLVSGVVVFIKQSRKISFLFFHVSLDTGRHSGKISLNKILHRSVLQIWTFQVLELYEINFHVLLTHHKAFCRRSLNKCKHKIFLFGNPTMSYWIICNAYYSE